LADIIADAEAAAAAAAAAAGDARTAATAAAAASDAANAITNAKIAATAADAAAAKAEAVADAANAAADAVKAVAAAVKAANDSITDSDAAAAAAAAVEAALKAAEAAEAAEAAAEAAADARTAAAAAAALADDADIADATAAAEAAAVKAEAAAAKAEAAAEAAAEATAAVLSADGAHRGKDIPLVDDFAFSAAEGPDEGDASIPVSVKDKVVLFGELNKPAGTYRDAVLKVTVNFSKLAELTRLTNRVDFGDIFPIEDGSFISLRPRVNRASGGFAGIKSTIYLPITTAAAGTTFTIPGNPADGQFPDEPNIDMVLDIVLKFRAFGGALPRGEEDNRTVWTIANGLYGDADNFPSTITSTLNGGIIVRLGKGSSQTGEGETSVRLEPELKE
jgi:hypothetical protein